MNLLVLAPFEAAELARLRELASVTYESWIERRHLMSPDELAGRLAGGGHDGCVVEAEFVTRDVFEAVPGLRLVASARGRPVNVDLAAATEHGCVVLETPGRNAHSVADLCMAMILDRARHLSAAARLVRDGGWVMGLDDDALVPYLRFRGFELASRTLGLVGLGAVGREVARRASGFGMRLLAHDPHVAAEVFAGAGAEPCGLDELLAAADVVSIHVELTDETRGLLDRRRLGLMRPGALLVNTARAAVVDLDAMTELVEEGRLGGVAFDVWAPEPIRLDHPLRRHDRALILPHLGGATDGAVRRHSEMIRADVERMVRGRRPRRCANPEVLDARAAGPR